VINQSDFLNSKTADVLCHGHGLAATQVQEVLREAWDAGEEAVRKKRWTTQVFERQIQEAGSWGCVPGHPKASEQLNELLVLGALRRAGIEANWYGRDANTKLTPDLLLLIEGREYVADYCSVNCGVPKVPDWIVNLKSHALIQMGVPADGSTYVINFPSKAQWSACWPSTDRRSSPPEPPEDQLLRVFLLAHKYPDQRYCLASHYKVSCIPSDGHGPITIYPDEQTIGNTPVTFDGLWETIRKKAKKYQKLSTSRRRGFIVVASTGQQTNDALSQQTIAARWESDPISEVAAVLVYPLPLFLFSADKHGLPLLLYHCATPITISGSVHLNTCQCVVDVDDANNLPI